MKNRVRGKRIHRGGVAYDAHVDEYRSRKDYRAGLRDFLRERFPTRSHTTSTVIWTSDEWIGTTDVWEKETTSEVALRLLTQGLRM